MASERTESNDVLDGYGQWKARNPRIGSRLRP